MESNVFVGVKFSPNGSGLSDELYSADPARFSKLPNNYDYILLPITNGKYRESVRKQFQEFIQRRQRESHQSCILKIKEPQLQELCIPPFNVSKTNSTPAYIGLLSSWLELESSDNAIRELSYQVLLNECRYARFVGIDKLIVAPPRELSDLQRYAQVISRLLNDEAISAHPPMLLSVSLPLYEDSDPLATWELWHTIRRLCDYHPSLTIALAVPRIRAPSHVLNRWLCEPVSCLLVSSSIFATNQYDYPVLHKFNQSLITKFQQINGNSQPNSNGELCIILHGMEKYASKIKGGEAAYLEYINYLLKRGDKQLITQGRNTVNHNGIKGKRTNNGDNNNNNENNKLISHSYLDMHSPRLMRPLEPHSDNLSNYVYSVFEKDIAKYGMYQLAIEKALKKLLSANISEQLTILIAGAGRGPLVDRTMHLLKHMKCQNQIQVIALEKNPQACLYLQKRNFDLWNNSVRIIMEDMREWKDETIKVDLCISELLGSFGCNELSPECLSAVERFHSKPSTIFIPQAYTSYIAPIASPLLYQKLKNREGGQDSPWVMHNIPYSVLSSKINELWSFEHPLGKNDENQFSKNANSEFKIKYRGELHGLVGYFTARLYEDVMLSTVPDDSTVKLLPGSRNGDEEVYTPNDSHQRGISNSDVTGLGDSTVGERFKKLGHTPDMYSWSPLVFPLKQPFTVTDDTELTVFLSRNHSPLEKRTWYEWSLESFVYLVVSGSPLHKMSTGTLKHTVHSKPQSSKNGQKLVATGDNGIQGSEGAPFDSSIPENAFLPRQESVWQSVSDIHGLSEAMHNTAEPMFDLKHENLDVKGEEEFEEEVHVRVKTGVSAFHNVNGKSFSIAL